MARYVTAKDSLFHDSFLNIDEAQNYAIDIYGAKLVDGLLCNKHGSRKPIKEIFEDNAFELKPSKNFIDPLGITESEVINVHIEDGQLVITIKDGTQKKIKY